MLNLLCSFVSGLFQTGLKLFQGVARCAFGAVKKLATCTISAGKGLLKSVPMARAVKLTAMSPMYARGFTHAMLVKAGIIEPEKGKK